MNRILLPEKALVVALDHARTLGVVKGLEDPGKVIDQVIDAGADGIMTSYGVVKKYRDRIIGRVPTFLRLEGFRNVTLNCPVPTLIAGGSKMDTEKAALEVLHGAMQGGAKGVVFGRNIWQSRNVPGTVAALRAIIHSGASVDQALERIGS